METFSEKPFSDRTLFGKIFQSEPRLEIVQISEMKSDYLIRKMF